MIMLDMKKIRTFEVNDVRMVCFGWLKLYLVSFCMSGCPRFTVSRDI